MDGEVLVKRSTAALLIAILLHTVLFLLFLVLNQVAPKLEKPIKPKEERIKLSLKERPKVSKNAAVKNAIKKPETPIAPPMPKGKQLKKIVPPETFIKHTPKPPEKPQPKPPKPKKITEKKPPKPKKVAPVPPEKPLIPVKKEPKKPTPPVKKIPKKPLPKKPPPKKTVPIKKKVPEPIVKPLEQNLTKAPETEKSELLKMLSKQEPIKVPKPVKETPPVQKNVPKESSQLFAMLSKKQRQPKKAIQEQRSHERSSQLSENFKEAYGEDFGKLSEGEQKYILDNEEIMRRITQQVLTRVGRVNIPDNMRINTTNIIEFYLHPNGDISDIKMVKRSGFYILDDTTKETIEYAYSRYPRPAQKTLIRYKVGYYLRGY